MRAVALGIGLENELLVGRVRIDAADHVAGLW